MDAAGMRHGVKFAAVAKPIRSSIVAGPRCRASEVRLWGRFRRFRGRETLEPVASGTLPLWSGHHLGKKIVDCGPARG